MKRRKHDTDVFIPLQSFAPNLFACSIRPARGSPVKGIQ